MGAVSLEDIVFDGNTIAHSSFNSVYQAGAKHFDITNSVFVYSYPWEYHPNGATQVLAGGVTGDATVRNEVRNNEFGWAGDYPGCPDGCAYDFEGPTSGVTFQHNFIHDTFGESVLFMPNCMHKDLVFDGNIFRNNVRFSPRWDIEVTLFPNNTGNGTFSNNVFFSRPGKRAINSKPACFTFTDNDEQATGTFVEMPLVTNVAYGDGTRTYTLACKTAGADDPVHPGRKSAHSIEHAIHRAGHGLAFGRAERQGVQGRLLRQLRQLPGCGVARSGRAGPGGLVEAG